jgi:DNA (cytosine-5)-methyltransferase 1
MVKDQLQILSFFCGAGGLDYGFRQEHFRVVLAFDNASAAVRTYNFNSKKRIAQVVDLSSLSVDRLVSMIDSSGIRPRGVIGGPPCQGFSRGNARSNPNDPRNVLPFRYARVLKALNSKYRLDFFVLENVMGLMTPKHVQRFKAILAAFDDAGFNVFHHSLNARAFGVPQNRPRLFIVGLNADKYPDAEFSFPTGSEPETTVRNAIQGLPKPVFFSRDIAARDIPCHPNHWTMVPKSDKFRKPARRGDGRSFRRLAWDEESPTVAYGNREIHIHPNGSRRLTVFEAMLLQGFPKTYRLMGNFSEQVTQISNAVPPPVARALAREIRLLLTTKRKRRSANTTTLVRRKC